MAESRVDELRKRLEKEPGSRLFAQLAEELRKEGDLEEAIRVSRDGLQKHPQYPSARITLGRALLDTGDAAGARREFETVLKAAPDNILASRYLGEALESLGDVEGARKRYRLTLTLSPGDKNVLSRLEALDAVPATVVMTPAAVTTRLTPPPAPAPQAPPAPPVAPAPAELPPIPLVDADVDFELERPHESPATAVGAKAPSVAPPPVAPPPPAPDPEAEQDFDFDASPPPRPAPVPFEPTLRVPLVDEPEPVAARPAAPVPPAPADEVEPIASPTLAELYYNQGFTKRAIEVYQKVLQREPGNERARARVRELEAAGATSAAPPAPLDRRAQVERTIEKLDTLRRALQGARS